MSTVKRERKAARRRARLARRGPRHAYNEEISDKMRRDAGFTQEALALKSGVSRNVLGDVESGKRGLLYERLFDIADALDVEVETLLARSTRRRRPR